MTLSDHARAGIIHGEVIAANVTADHVKLGKYVTISPTVPQNGMRAAAAAIGRIARNGAASAVVGNNSFVVVSDREPSLEENFLSDFMLLKNEPMQASKGNTLKYITLCESLPAAMQQRAGHVIGKIVDLDDDMELKSLTLCNVVIAVEVPENSVTEPKSENLDFLEAAPPNLDELLEKTAKSAADGTLEMYSNANDVSFMKNLVVRLEKQIAAKKSKEGFPQPQ